jgi:hypothetical protein
MNLYQVGKCFFTSLTSLTPEHEELVSMNDIDRVIIWTGIFIFIWAGFLCFIRFKNYLQDRFNRADPLQPPDYEEERFSLRRLK